MSCQLEVRLATSVAAPRQTYARNPMASGACLLSDVTMCLCCKAGGNTALVRLQIWQVLTLPSADDVAGDPKGNFLLMLGLITRASPGWPEIGRRLVPVSLTADSSGSGGGTATMLVPALGVRRSSSSSLEKSPDGPIDAIRDVWRGPAASVWPVQVGLAERQCEHCTNEQYANCG